nr:hypothetical protein B0A51_13857 [Rachicladosporium sp. CCFEE 5018]
MQHQQAGQQQDGYRSRTPATPAQQSQYQHPQAQRAGQSFVPPPPPLQHPQPVGQQGQFIPPPPPRMPTSAVQQHGTWIPGPPSQPQTYWNANRQPTYPPPQIQAPREQKPYNPGAYSGQYMTDYVPNFNLAEDPNRPLTSATYVPGGDTFGPGVGIPGLNLYNDHLQAPVARPNLPQQNSYRNGASGDFSAGYDTNSYQTQRSYGNDGHTSQPDYGRPTVNTYHQTQPTPPPQPQAQPPPLPSNYPPPTPTSRQKTLILPAKETQEHSSPAQESSRNTFSHVPPSQLQSSETSSNREHSSSGEHPGSPSDQHWPKERVAIWLAAHNFSREWQAAFEHLQVHGALFLDIGRRSGVGGNRNIGFMPQTVLPQVARECTANGVVWDQAKEREEGKRIRRLIKDIIATGGAASTPATAGTSSTSTASLPFRGHARRESSQFVHNTSAGTEGGVENSPNLSRPENNLQGSTPSTAGGTGDDSPGRTMPPSIAQRRYSGQRSVTLDSYGLAANETGRSAASQSALASISDVPRRHSPSASAELSSANGTKGYSYSPSQSPGLANARLVDNNGSSRYYGGHLRSGSSQSNVPTVPSNLSPGPGKQSATPSNRDSDSMFAKPMPQDASARRHGTDGYRPQPTDSSVRQPSQETPASAKEHRGFLEKFRRKKKDDMHPSPDEEHSPASPQATRQAPYGRAANASSDVSLDRPASRKSGRNSMESSEVPPMPIRGRPTAREDDKKFIFVTPDGWNYRLIDITDLETADQLRTVICFNLGIPDTSEVEIHMTGPGKTEHDEPLNDKSLMDAGSRIADPSASLKLFVQGPDSLGQPPQSSGLGLHMASSPFGQAAFGNKPMDEATYARLERGMTSPTTSTMRSGESTLVPDKLRNLQSLQKDIDTVDSDAAKVGHQEDMLQHDFASLPEAERLALLEAKAEEHRKETERKQKAYLDRRRNQLSHEGGKRVHDFDNPRNSPYGPKRPPSGETQDPDRKSDILVPMRKAPPVPEPTSTLVKANSLTKKQAPNARTSWPDRKEEPWKRISSGSIPEEEGKRPASRGIGAALAGAGKVGGMFGVPNSAPTTSSGLQKSSTAPDLLEHAPNSTARSLAGVDFNRQLSGRQQSPSSPFTMSKGGQSFKIPEYDEVEEKDEDTLRASQQRPNLTLRTPSNAALTKVKQQGAQQSSSRSPDVSPSTAHPPGKLNRLSSRRSYGPSFHLPDKPVQFATSPAMGAVPDDSDEDSDDGLFAIPLASQKAKMAASRSNAKVQQVLGISQSESQSASRSPSRPDLKLKTSRAHVQFAANPPPEEKPNDAIDMERHVPASAASTQWSAESPDESSRFGRRESFASDVWANRPPAEALVEHLDEFFPNVDLDQPMVDPDENSESATATEKSLLSAKSSNADLGSSISRSITPLSSADENDTLGSNESTLKRSDQLPSVAVRNVRKSGGLGRTKSIREVVKGAYQMEGRQQQVSTSSYASSRASNGAPAVNPLLNRVSTLRAGGSDIVRRKSTKMFGARIEQVKPSRGSRLISLETIPQDTLPPSSVQHMKQQHPERQPTFKWMRGQLIGKGTFGRVYLGMNTTTGELLAVKQVEVNPKAQNADPAKIRDMVKALDLEIDTMQHLDHVNIVQYLGCEKKEFSISIFLEYISGGSVGSCLRKHGKFEESVVSSLTRQTLCGLAYLHGQGILHRDLKSDNILLDLDGTCKISDLGISKRSADPYINDASNSMQGSVFWMAPEVIRATQSQAHMVGAAPETLLNQGYSAKVDIWSLGCVVLEMFAGRRPWSKEEAIGAIYKLGSLNQAPPIPDDVSTVVGPGALSFMYDCFTIDPAERPTAETLLRAPFTQPNHHYNFLDTALYAKIRGAF